MPFGVTSTGFVAKTYEAILEEKKDRAKILFGDDVDLTDTSPLYKMLQIQALEEQVLWDMAEDFYYAAYIDYATGISLDRVAALIGTVRKEATKATGQVTFTGTNGTNIPAGTVVQTTGDDVIKFLTDSLVVIAGGTATVNITAKYAGADGNVAANTITELETPIVGVSTVNNAAATDGGTDIETDDDFRARCKGALTALAKGTLEAIRLAVLAVSGVTSVSAFEDLDIHKVTLYVDGVTKPNADVDAAIEDTRPAGIPVDWYEVTDINVYVDIDVTVDAEKVPADGHDQIENAILAYINGLGAGDDVIYSKIYDVVYDAEEDEAEEWILDVTSLKTGLSSPPTGTSNLDIDFNEKAITDATKVVVTITQV